MSAPNTICLIGCGRVFDAIAIDTSAYGLEDRWIVRAAPSVAQLAASAASLLEGLDPATTRVFAAVDENALNYARLELYGAARLAGLRLATLIHARAWRAPDAKLGDNVWLGPAALVAAGAQLSGDVMVNAGARIDAGARIAAHVWIGAGATVGADAAVGTHSVIGADVLIRAGTQLGRHCVIDRPGPWERSLPDGSMLDTRFATPARIIGAGYSFHRRT
jgi:carbonic anhydrase/acetyltransferase-like protein (isoleucine patch superfamily)